MNIFVIGNGKSLNKTHPSKIEDYNSKHYTFTVGTNLLPLMYDKTDWRPDYYLSVSTAISIPEYEPIIVRGLQEVRTGIIANQRVFDYIKRERLDISSTKPRPGRFEAPLAEHFIETYEYPIRWSNEMSKACKFGMSHFVTFQYIINNIRRWGNVQDLCFYLIGFDGNYKPLDKDGSDPNHFSDEYWNNPFHRRRELDLERTNRDHLIVHSIIWAYARKMGFRVINCTPNSAFTMYPYQNFEEVIYG